MTETGFYAMGTWGAEPGRVAAVARHLPDAVVYVYGRHAIKDLFGWHGVTTVVTKCPTPGCTGLTPTQLRDWIRARNPDRLVTDAYPYGVLDEELLDLRPSPTMQRFFLQRRTTTPTAHRAEDFTAVLNADLDLGPGTDLHPLLPFDADEMPTRSRARAELGGGDRPIVMLIGEGTSPNFNDFVIRACAKRGLDHVIVNTYPVMTLMPGADLVVGYAGFSQTEAAAVGVPMAAITNFNDTGQSWRANTTPASLTATIASLEVREAPETLNYTNRARRAAALIARNPRWESVDG